MDSNRTRFHLLLGRDDWAHCTVDGTSSIFDSVQQAEQLALACGRGYVIVYIFVEDDEPGGVPLVRRHVAEAGRHVAREIQLVDHVGAEPHRRAGIEQDQELRIGLAAVALEVHPLGTGENVPVDVAQVVSGSVGAVFGEFLAESEIGGAVQARHKAVDYGLGYQIQAVDRCQSGGI